MLRINLNVPFEEKDKAKALGARWDPEARCWYVPADIDPSPFARWREVSSRSRANVRAKKFGVALNETRCWKCHELTPVACIVVAPYHQQTGGDDDDEDGDQWETMDYASVLSTITYVSPAALEQIHAIAPWLEIAYSRTAGQKYLANVCHACDVLQGDFFMHSEPGGAFFPMDEQEEGRIRIQWIDLPIYVDAGEIGIDTEWVR